MSVITRAYVIAGIVGALAPIVGVFMVQRRLALIGDGLGHLAFAGVALAAVIGLAPLPAGLVVAISGAILVELLQRNIGTRADVALSVIFYLGLAGGVILLSTARTFNASALGILFGSLLTSSPTDVWVTGAVLSAVALVVIAFYRTFFVLVLNEEVARVEGVGVAKFSLLLSALTAAVVVSGIRAVGVLLVAALMVMPAATGQRLARSFSGSTLVAVATGLASAVSGVWISVFFDLPPGATIVLLSVVVYLAGIAAGRALRGVSAQSQKRLPPSDPTT